MDDPLKGVVESGDARVATVISRTLIGAGDYHAVAGRALERATERAGSPGPRTR